jgi:hypothetical protein
MNSDHRIPDRTPVGELSTLMARSLAAPVILDVNSRTIELALRLDFAVVSTPACPSFGIDPIVTLERCDCTALSVVAL